jgi:hypothetical protein
MNPFEIRTEMLKLAKEYLDQQFWLNRDLYEKMMEQGKIQIEEYNKTFTMYSTDELMAKAKEMYSFVTTKDPS